MASTKTPFSPLTILMIVIVLAALASRVVVPGKYDTLAYQANQSFIVKTDSGEISVPFSQTTLDSLGIRILLQKFENGSIQKPVSIPNTYHAVERNKQGFIDILQAPLKGLYESVDIVFFILVLGAFINVFDQTGALKKSLYALALYMKGRENWLIIILTFLFSLAASSYGMAEEALAFYPFMIPLFLAAGYDRMIPVAVIFGGTSLGSLSSFSNPFATIIASNAAGVSWVDGLYGRIAMFLISTALYIFYILRYANKVKANPGASLVSPEVNPEQDISGTTLQENEGITVTRMPTNLLVTIFGLTFATMIAGVILWEWWFIEMSTVILGATLLLGFLTRMKEKDFMRSFIKGAENMLSVSLIVGVARGISIVLNNGNISGTILYASATAVSHMPSTLFIILLFCLFMFFTLFISSSSGMAVLTMPIMGGLAVLIGVPGREIVNAYLFGMGIMCFMTPTGLVLPSLALGRVSLKDWWRFIYPFLVILFILCSIFLVLGILV